MLRKILVANRGEIAVRIIRACHELGIQAVAAYSEADRESLAVRMADEAICIGPPAPAKSYLNAPALISAALVSDCDAIHPGYGFLSENPYFAESCAQCGITFIGPSADSIKRMGDKSLAKQAMKQAGLPLVPGTENPLVSVEEAQELADEIGYPVLLKAVAGGGGRGMRVVHHPDELARAFATARGEAETAFGRGDLYMEKYLPTVRHVEIQVLADQHGNALHLGERDCSLQRRHQKVVEEGPSPALTPALRAKMGEAALHGVREIGYYNAGTMEFLLDPQGHFYFMEMNTRLQVEHPVTEWLTGLDLVKWQIRIAAGERLTLTQDDIKIRGHSIECRINAEDATRDFLPAGGTIDLYLPPGGPGVRVDSHLYSGYRTPTNYDSMLAKIIVWGETRMEAIERMRRALSECVINGITTTLPFQLQMMHEPAFVSGDVATNTLAGILENRK